MASQVNSIKHLTKTDTNLILTSENGERNIPNLFYDANVTLILKSDKNIIKEETKDPYPSEHRQTEKILNKI